MKKPNMNPNRTNRLTFRKSNGKAAFLLDGKQITGAVAERLAMYEERFRWVSVDDRLPEDDEVVLVFGGRSIYTAVHNPSDKDGYWGWWKMNSTYHPCNPKYWMKLPDVPGGEKND